MEFSPSIQLGAAFVFVVALMTALWFVQRRTGNAGIVDIAWSGAIGIQGLFYGITGDGFLWRRVMASTLIALWSLRLTAYLFRRVVGEPEEGRYATLRANWGSAANRKLFWFYQMQAAAAFLFAVPVFLASRNVAPHITGLDIAGAAIWLLGMVGVTVADRQLERFRNNPANRGTTCRAGLWRYSRHPNYFFEWIHWWAYVLLAVGAPYWWVSIVVPLALLYFILFKTGIPPTEAQAIASRGEDYLRYQRSTSAFVPWFPRKENA